MLFLTGDQIYADDVAAALLPGLNTLTIALISDDAAGVEQIVSPAGGGPFNVTTTVLPAGFRQKLTGAVGFTSEEAACHLLGFGEWLAMYCIAWNPYLWPVLAVADLSDPSVPADLKSDLQRDAKYSPDNAPRTLGRPTPDAANDVITPLYGAPQVAHDALHDAFQAFLTDKATLEVESPASGVLLDIFFKDGDDVPVMTSIAAIGEPPSRHRARRQAQHVGAEPRGERRGLHRRAGGGARGATGVHARGRRRDGSRRVQLPEQAIPDPARLGDVHWQSGSESDAADHG